MTERAHEQEVTGRGLHLFGAALQPATKDKSYQPFFTDHTPVQYGRTREVDVRHIKLEVSFDIPAKRVIGVAHLTFAPLDDVTALTLDACDMTIGEISLGGKPIKHDYDGTKLRLRLGRSLAQGRSGDDAMARMARTMAGTTATLWSTRSACLRVGSARARASSAAAAASIRSWKRGGS